MVGFNRRFAPYTEVLKNIPENKQFLLKEPHQYNERNKFYDV